MVEEAEMKSPVLKTFLVGVAFGIGLTVLSLYAQKPGCFVTSLETIAEKGASPKGQRRRKQIPKKEAEGNGLFG